MSKLKEEIQKMAGELGIEINFNSDSKLEPYGPGKLLTWKQLRDLPENAVVWLYIYYKESVRANHAFNVSRTESGDFFFDDGSSFAADLRDKGEDSDLVDVNECDCITKVYEAIGRKDEE